MEEGAEKIKLTKDDVRQMIADWRAKDDLADVWCFANMMAEIIEQYLPTAPEVVSVEPM